MSEENDLKFTNTPNLLTLARILMVPLVVLALRMGTYEGDIAAAILFSVAAITDYFDGYYARIHKLVTVYGKLMDPLADKFLVVCSVVVLQELGRISPIVTMLLICRELAITSLRALASAEGVVIDASGGGKWKAALQMIAIPFLMVKEGLWGLPLLSIGTVLLGISLGLSLWSAKDYAVDFFRNLRVQRREKTHLKRLARDTRDASRKVRLEAKMKKLTEKKKRDEDRSGP